jgi:hypothetical protein
MIPTVVFLAAGMSTRYGRLKQLEPVGPDGEALLDYAVFDAVRAGFSRVLLIIREELERDFRAHIRGRWPKDLEVAFHHQRIDDLPGVAPTRTGRASPPSSPGPSEVSPLDVVLRKREKPWGTAHALLTAREQLEGPFVVLNADDFYGRSAFRQAAEFLSEESRSGAGVGRVPTFGLVAYLLQDTLSEHGGVSRGICRVGSDGWLEAVEEVLEIRRGYGGISGKTLDGRPLILKGTEAVSTNFWIFTSAVFPLLEVGFVRFFRALREGASGQPEFLIPAEVNGALETGVARVRTIPTLDRFLGITHPEDRRWVVAGLAEMTEEGRYPDSLWA